MLTILLATDFGKASESAFRYSLMLAGGRPCRLVVTHIFKHKSPSSLNEEQLRAFVRQEREEATDRTRKFSRLYPDAHVPEVVSQCTIDILVDEGTVSDTLLRLAKEQKADVIVIGSKKHPGILKRMFGQISLTLIYSRTCPVLVVPEDTMEVGTERVGLLSLNLADEEKLFGWKGRTGLPIHDARICRLHGSNKPAANGEIPFNLSQEDKVFDVLNASGFHLLAVLVSGAEAFEEERREFIHSLYRRSTKPFLCLNLD